MRKRLTRAAAFLLCVVLCIPQAFSAGPGAEKRLRVGLAYGSGALTAANLQNNSGYGSGYRFGYFRNDLTFEEVGSTDARTEQITVLPTVPMYRSGSSYSTSGSGQAIGCYHVLMEVCADFDQAQALAGRYQDGFPAWINGEYQVRVGAYETKEEAEQANASLNGRGVQGTGSYGVNVVATGSSQILFQFDGGQSRPLGVMPDVTGAPDVRTWFKGYKYRGGFRYERIGGGSALTVVNVVDMETYIKGVIPYEMSNDWPMEALKTQAVCARSYAYQNIAQNRHSKYGFDLCNTTDCQVYHGVGSGSNRYQANERTDRAVDETAGMYGLYDGQPIQAFYSSSHGGASESVENVWGTKLSKFPYLCGVKDPYEQDVARLNPKSSWEKTYTRQELTSRLQSRGYGVGTMVESMELTYSPLGNVIQVKVNYENRRSNSFTPKMSWGVLSLFGLSSLHFTINGAGAESGRPTEPGSGNTSQGGLVVNGQDKLDPKQPVYTISGSGTTTQVNTDGLYVISGNGTVSPALDQKGGQPGEKPDQTDTPAGTVVTVSGDRYVIRGGGNGHQIGMSQYGAYAMAQRGFTYDEIVEFYYPGVRVGAFNPR